MKLVPKASLSSTSVPPAQSLRGGVQSVVRSSASSGVSRCHGDKMAASHLLLCSFVARPKVGKTNTGWGGRMSWTHRLFPCLLKPGLPPGFTSSPAPLAFHRTALLTGALLWWPRAGGNQCRAIFRASGETGWEVNRQPGTAEGSLTWPAHPTRDRKAGFVNSLSWGCLCPLQPWNFLSVQKSPARQPPPRVFPQGFCPALLPHQQVVLGCSNMIAVVAGEGQILETNKLSINLLPGS